MAKNKYRFKGHESFILREGWLNKGLEAVRGNPCLFHENSGAETLGVGVNMAKAIRYWLKCAGLTLETHGEVHLTELGEAICENDPYLEDIFSLWIVHCNIVRNRELATAWWLFFARFDLVEFRPETMKREMILLASELPDVGKLSERSVGDDCDAILRMYGKSPEKDLTPEEKNVSPFSALGLIRYVDGAYRKVQPKLDRLPAEVAEYLLCGTDAVSISDLLEQPGNPGKVLNLKRNGLTELLERLLAAGRLEMNRTAGLDMVYLKEKRDAMEIVRDYYKHKK